MKAITINIRGPERDAEGVIGYVVSVIVGDTPYVFSDHRLESKVIPNTTLADEVSQIIARIAPGMFHQDGSTGE